MPNKSRRTSPTPSTANDLTTFEAGALLERPPRVVLYLGAGASQFAGYRTFAEFPRLLFNQDVRKKEELPPIPDNAARLLQDIKVSLEGTDGWTTHDRFLWRLNEYQQILTLNLSDPAVQPFLRPASQQLFELSCCTTAARNVMAQTTVRHYSSNRVVEARSADPALHSNMRRVYDLYMKMAALNKSTGCLPVFTTNYDMLLDDLCTEFADDSRRAPLANGFPHIRDEGEKWQPHTCSGYCNSCSVLQYYRLHGCAAWFYAEPGDPNVYFRRSDASTEPITNLCAMYPGLERERGAGPHGHGFRALYRLLRVCNVIVFIGFSFRDDDVMHVILNALAERPNDLKLLIVDSAFTETNIVSRLAKAARRSAFPARPPVAGSIKGLKLQFGIDAGFDVSVFDECQKLMRKG